MPNPILDNYFKAADVTPQQKTYAIGLLKKGTSEDELAGSISAKYGAKFNPAPVDPTAVIQSTGLSQTPQMPDMITQLRGMGKSEADINTIMKNVSGTPQGPTPATGIDAVKPMLETSPMERAKGAVSGVVEGEKALIGGGYNAVNEGGQGVANAVTSPDTFNPETNKMEPTPAGKDRGLINRAEQGLFSVGHIIGGLGTMALGIAPSTIAVEAGAGALKPEISTAVKGYTDLWKALPGNVRRTLTDTVRGTQIPGSIYNIGQITDSLTNAPEAVKQGFADIIKSTGLLTIPSTLRQYQSVLDTVMPEQAPYEETMMGKVQTKSNLDNRQIADAKTMRASDPARASELTDKADEMAATGDQGASPMKDVGKKVKATRDALYKEMQSTGNDIGNLREGIKADELPIDTKPLVLDMKDKLSSSTFNVTFNKNGTLAKEAFENSTIPLTDQKYIENMYNKIRSGELTYSDMESNVQKWGSELYSPTGDKALGDAATTFERAVRDGSRQLITAQYPDLAEPLAKYSELKRSIGALDRVIGMDGEKATAFVRLINGANSDRYEGILQSVEDLAAKYGIAGGDNLINEARYAGDLESLAGVKKPYELAGRVESAIESPTSAITNMAKGAIKEGITGNPLESIRKIVEYAPKSGSPALTALADWLEKDITPQLEKAYGAVKGAVTGVASNESGSAMMPTGMGGVDPRITTAMRGESLDDLQNIKPKQLLKLKDSLESQVQTFNDDLNRFPELNKGGRPPQDFEVDGLIRINQKLNKISEITGEPITDDVNSILKKVLGKYDLYTPSASPSLLSDTRGSALMPTAIGSDGLQIPQRLSSLKSGDYINVNGDIAKITGSSTKGLEVEYLSDGSVDTVSDFNRVMKATKAEAAGFNQAGTAGSAKIVKVDGENTFQYKDAFGGSLDASVKNKTATVYDAWSKEPGHHVYENAVNEMKKMGINIIEVPLQSVDSTGALNALIKKGILSEGKKLWQGVPTIFKIL